MAAFILTASDISGESAAAAFVTALPAIKELLARAEPPFIARVSPAGAVTHTLDREGIATRIARKRAKPSP